jgi:low affinity Fe/Cu permease
MASVKKVNNARKSKKDSFSHNIITVFKVLKKTYIYMEKGFEKLTSIGITLLGNSVTFIVALILVIYWLSNKKFYTQDIHYSIGDVILGITFLSLFIIQKSFNRSTAAIHIKINELIVSHDAANNEVINLEKKTEHEITELSKEYAELVEQTKEDTQKKF